MDRRRRGCESVESYWVVAKVREPSQGLMEEDEILSINRRSAPIRGSSKEELRAFSSATRGLEAASIVVRRQIAVSSSELEFLGSSKGCVRSRRASSRNCMRVSDRLAYGLSRLRDVRWSGLRVLALLVAALGAWGVLSTIGGLAGARRLAGELIRNPASADRALARPRAAARFRTPDC